MYYSPKTSTDGLVFHYDTGNTVRSYLGEPTINLLYSPGAYNLIDGATDIYGRVTKTNLGGGKYRFVNNGTGVSTIRLYTNQSDLINGATYGCSVYFENLVGSLAIDWCDTSITGVNSSTSPSGRLYGTGTRALYDGPYYFLDVDLSTGGAVTLYDPQVEYRSHVTPFVAGTRSATQGLLDLTGNSTIDLTNVSFDSNAQMTFDGTDDSVFIGTIGGYTNNVTCEAIFKTTSGATWKDIIAGGCGDILFTVNGSKLNFGAQCNSPIPHANFSTTDVNTGEWFHGIATYDGSTVKIYINGVLESTNNRSGNFTPSNMRIGSADAGSSEFFNGDLPIVKLYNRALTADEVQRNFNAVKSRFNIA